MAHQREISSRAIDDAIQSLGRLKEQVTREITEEDVAAFLGWDLPTDRSDSQARSDLYDALISKMGSRGAPQIVCGLLWEALKRGHIRSMVAIEYECDGKYKECFPRLDPDYYQDGDGREFDEVSLRYVGELEDFPLTINVFFDGGE